MTEGPEKRERGRYRWTVYRGAVVPLAGFTSPLSAAPVPPLTGEERQDKGTAARRSQDRLYMVNNKVIL